MKTDPAPGPKPPTSLDEMMREFAAGLKDVIEDTELAYLERDPEEAFTDLTCRLIFRLRGRVTIVPAPTNTDRVRKAQMEAATRTLNIFTDWLRKHPECSYTTRISASGKFQFALKTPRGAHLFFGESVQDAYAQAAQAINFGDEL